MTNGLFDDRLSTVAAEISAAYNSMVPLVSGLDQGDDMLLSKILYLTSSSGTASSDRELLRTAVALEILRVAINIGSVTDSDFSDDRLLSTDYLYAEAINQVVNLNRPFIISILATAIANTADKRADDSVANPDIEHLIFAAFELGKRLGKCEDDLDMGEILRDLGFEANGYMKSSLELTS